MRMGSRRDPPVEGIDLYRPVRFIGKVLRLHYAREQELQPYLGMVAAKGELFQGFSDRWLSMSIEPCKTRTISIPSGTWR